MSKTRWRNSSWFFLCFRLLAAGLASVPFLLLAWRVVQNDLGPDPGQEVTQVLGLAAFQLLMATLCMTPMQRWSGWGGWIRIRRMLGLFAFFYACLHVLSFLQFIVGWQDLWSTFTKRPYIIAGSLAFLILVPLALTSTKGMMKRLGRNWKRLHRLVYLSAVSAWIHFIWQARSDIGEMVVYGVLIAVLLWIRTRWNGWQVLMPLRSETEVVKR